MSNDDIGVWLTTEQTAERLSYSFDTFSALSRYQYFGLKRRCADGVSELSRGRRQYFNLDQIDRVVTMAKAAGIRRRTAMRVIVAIDEGRVAL